MTHVVVGIIKYDDRESYLLVSSKTNFDNYSGYYYPPAGHVEKGEDELTALEREIKEELDLNIINAEKFVETEGDIKDQKTSWYICEVENYNFNTNKEELQDAGFFTQQEIESMKIWPATQKIFEEYIFNKE